MTGAPLPFATAPAGHGEAFWWFGQLAVIKADAAHTCGRYTLVELTAPPSYASPLHVHHREDEAFWVLEGSTRFEVGDVLVDAAPGTYLIAPRATPHRWAAGPEGARLLFLFTPGGFERLIAATGLPARALTVPPPELPVDPRVESALRRHGTELLVADRELSVLRPASGIS
jgi:mannose-6-phosphate isomerase-like protein (cupin superfamily)